MKYLSDAPPRSLRDLTVIVRAGLDVPLSGGDVAGSFRLKRAALTLNYLREKGARTIVLSHLGRAGESNEPVARALKRYAPLSFVPDLLGKEARAALHAMRDGDIVILENLRRDPREEENDEGFAQELANMGDVYVNDAFSVSHREHASIVGVPRLLPSYAGLLMKEEIEHLLPARTPPSPSLAIIGGSKFETKEPLIEALLETYDHVFVTGALMNDIYRAEGLAVGRSLISDKAPSRAIIDHPRLIIPSDVTVERSDGQALVKLPPQVDADDKIVDIGPDAMAQLAPHLMQAKMVLWNGPSGLYEDGFISWTHAIAEIIAQSGAHSIIGGNNTLAAIATSGVSEDRFTFLSTGGGSMLEFLLKGTLPGLEALR